MAVLRSVAKTDTLESQRQKINQIAQDLFDVQTSVGEGGFSLSDGSVSSPALFFTNQPSVGLFKPLGKTMYVASDGKSVASFSSSNLTALQDFRTLVSAVPVGANGITITNPGSLYSYGVFSSIPLTGGSGSGIKANITVRAISGNITSGGSGYVGGSYVSVPLTGGTGTGATADITVSPFSGSIQNGGSGGDIGANASQIFTNVSLTGGSGSGMRADITATKAGPVVSVTSITVVNQGSGYQAGDILSATPAAIAGISGFQYVINGVGNVTQVQILLSNGGYQVGNVLTASNSSLGGSGSGFQFTVTGVGSVIDASVTDGGDGYLIGDQLSVNPVELAPSETWYVRMWRSQLFEFSGTLPTTGFNVGNTLSYAGETRTIVKRYLNQSNQVEAVIVRAGSEDGNTIQFSPGLTASDGNGNTASVASSKSALNYYFSLNPEGPWENLKDFTFQKNKRYIFNQANSSNNSHPIRFSTTGDGIHTVLSGQGAQTDYGDPYEGSEVNYQYTSVDVSIIPNANTPTTLYYYCGNGFSNPLNEHIDEGGFDGREAKITISGEATVSGSGLIFTVAAINTASNIILKKNGESTLGATTASSLSLTGELAVGSSAILSGDVTIGINKFTVDSSTGNTIIAGSLTVQDELSFLSDASFGSTLFVDSVNKRVSVNVDPAVTPLEYDFEVAGELSVTDNAYMASQQESFVRIGSGSTGTDKLQVSGNISTSTKFIAPETASIRNPQYTFSSNLRYGLHFSSVDDVISIVGSSGKIIGYESDSVEFYRNTNFNYDEVVSTKLTTGSGYTTGSYSGISLLGGTGSGAAANIIISFTTPIGQIDSVNNISAADSSKVSGTYTISEYTTSGDGEGAVFSVVINGSGAASVTVTYGGFGYNIGDTITIAGSSFIGVDPLVSPQNVTFDVSTLTSNPGAGYTDATYDNVPLTGGSGTGASASITISSGKVTEVVVTNAGNNYLSGDTLSFNHTSLSTTVGAGIITSTAPSTAASLKIDKIGTVSKVTIVDYGEGYISGDVLTFQNLTGTPSEIASLLIETVNSVNTISIDKDLGKITLNTLTSNNSIDVGGKLSLQNNVISSSSNDDIIITPGAASKLLTVSGSGGIKLPVGNSTNRPAASTVGIIRYNTQTSQYEGSNGTNFISLGGVRDVDGNTYIIAEESTGANDNTLYFYNDNYNSVRLERTGLDLITATTISSKDTDGKFKWKPSTAYLLNAFVYHADNVYQVTTAGTTGIEAPTHITGVETNGTASLTYVGTIYGDLVLKANNINFDGSIQLSSALKVYSYNTNNLILENSVNTFKFAFGNNNDVPDTLLSLTTTGSVQINKNYNTLNSENNITLFDYTTKFIELDDVRIETNDLSLTRGATENGNITVYNPTNAKGAKVIIIAQNTTTGDSHIVEYNIISKGSNIYVNEYGNLDTGVEQYSVVWDFAPSGNVQGLVTLNSALSSGNAVVITSTITQIKK